MPLLSLIFSALFILFGTVIVQAFRSASVSRSCPVSRRDKRCLLGGRGADGAGSQPPVSLFQRFK